MLLQKRSSRDGWAGSKGGEKIFPPSNQDALWLKFLLGKKNTLVLALGLASERAAD